jgi:predicted enzyme related to lactoylglutathione lyase
MANEEVSAPGRFCWIELATTDQAAAKAFYQGLFGWDANDFPMGPNPTDLYTVFQLDEKDVAAAYTLLPDQASHGVPPHWLLYVASDDVDATAKETAELGGKVVVPPFEVGEFGRMTVLLDPCGAAFAALQANQNPGIGRFGEIGSLCWADLIVPEPKKVQRFYASLFKWEWVLGKDADYLHIVANGNYIGGMPPTGPETAKLKPHWLAYFLVSDLEASTSRATASEARLHRGPVHIPDAGSFTILTDPQGAAFALFKSERAG